MRILVLTDTSAHSVENSMYGIVNALKAHNEVSDVFLADRNLDSNQAFFDAQSGALSGYKLDSDIQYPLNLSTTELKEMDFNSIDICFLRLPRPIHPEFFSHLKQFIPDKRIVNRPSGIDKSSNKSFLLDLDQFTVPMQLCTSWVDIESFTSKYACVLKPLLSYGGKGIVKIKDGQVDYEGQVISIDAYKNIFNESPQDYLAMEYTENVSKGDKRIVVAGGKILSTALRLPKDGGWLCNIAQGGSSYISEPDETELNMVRYISPILEELGIFYFGLDTLEGNDGKRFISEINTLSIGGIVPAQNITGQNLTGQFADLFVKYCQKQR